jgi:hypothetical protein
VSQEQEFARISNTHALAAEELGNVKHVVGWRRKTNEVNSYV